MPNDEVIFVMNENFRDPNKPYFDRVYMKGGEMHPRRPAQCCRLKSSISPGVHRWSPRCCRMLDEGKGALIPTAPVNVERMAINHSDPWTEVDGQISEMNTPHPVLSDPAVRHAMMVGINRQLIADEFYGMGATAAKDVVNGDPCWILPTPSMCMIPTCRADPR